MKTQLGKLASIQVTCPGRDTDKEPNDSWRLKTLLPLCSGELGEQATCQADTRELPTAVN